MSAPASDELRELSSVLAAASDSGEMRSIEELREELNVGTAEVATLLDTLRENGQAVEHEPGLWSGPGMDDGAGDEPAPVRVHVDDEPVVADDGERDEWGRPSPRGLVERLVGPTEPSVRLTRGMVDALDAAAVGALIKTGVKESGDGGVFVLEVRP